MLAESKFNSIETLISQALGDLDISHEEFIMILKEKRRHERMKCNLISENGDKKARNFKIKQYKIKKINDIKNFLIFLFFLYIKDGYKHVRNNK